METVTKILIVEDEMIIAANISLQLSNLGYEITGIIPRGEEALLHIQQDLPHIILMDINLKGDLDGVEIASLIHKSHKIPIIFLTANSDKANFNRAKATNPYGFISKPFKKIDLQRVIELANIRIKEEQAAIANFESNGAEPFLLSDCIFVRNHDKMIKVFISDILFFEADRNYCKIHCKDKEHLLVLTLKDVEKKLTSKNFLRIHRSFIVNITQIDEIATSHVVIAKKAIPFSLELRKELLLHIQKV